MKLILSSALSQSQCVSQKPAVKFVSKARYSEMKVLWEKKERIVNAVHWNAPLPALPSLRKQKIYQPYPDTTQQGRPVLSHLSLTEV